MQGIRAANSNALANTSIAMLLIRCEDGATEKTTATVDLIFIEGQQDLNLNSYRYNKMSLPEKRVKGRP